MQNNVLRKTGLKYGFIFGQILVILWPADVLMSFFFFRVFILESVAITWHLIQVLQCIFSCTVIHLYWFYLRIVLRHKSHYLVWPAVTDLLAFWCALHEIVLVYFPSGRHRKYLTFLLPLAACHKLPFRNLPYNINYCKIYFLCKCLHSKGVKSKTAVFLFWVQRFLRTPKLVVISELPIMTLLWLYCSILCLKYNKNNWLNIKNNP